MISDIESLIQEIKVYNPHVDAEKLRMAWHFASEAHKGQKRLTGEDFIQHPLQVAKTLVYWRLDETSVIAALLHDTIEDGQATRKEIVKLFGEDVARLVDGVTKVTSIRLRGSKELEFIESLRKMIIVMARDIRVVLLKLADRLHNMRTLHALSPERQYSNALETLEVYAPLAERLGMGEIKGVLQDLAFPYVYPNEYKKIVFDSEPYYRKAQKHLLVMKDTLTKIISAHGIEVEVKGRKKHYYSLWKKLSRSSINGDYDKVNDIIAFRILVGTIRECYETLGLVHAHYKPVPNKTLSDFIAQPKPNGYRSLHTKVFGEGGRIVEIQIRTRKMHAEAEHGAAAHWAYSESKSKGTNDETLDKKGVQVDENKKWVKQLVKWHEEISDSKEFLEAVKLDAFSTRILVFSPKGDVYDLPVNATPIDFAYAVHSDLGRHIESAIVNDMMVNLSTPLVNGDIVQIKKSKKPKGPYKGWLDWAVTTKARLAITRQLRK